MEPETVSVSAGSTGWLSSERLVVGTVALGTMLVPLNSTMIAVALPGIMDDFGVGVASAGWLITAYLAAMASLQPVAGKLGDRLGRRRLVIGGLLAFGATSVGAALAPNLWVLLAFRTLQAVAGALIVPNGAALLREAVPEERRGRSFGSLGVAVALAAGAGPPVGGILVEVAGWRAIFYANLVLVAPAVVLGWRCLPRPKLTAVAIRFDVPGALLLPVVLVLSAGLLMSAGRGLSPFVISVGVAAAVAIGAAFAVQELRHPDPVFQPRLFRRRAFAAANGGIVLANLSMYTLLLSVPLLLIDGDGVSSLRTGMVLAALSASMIVLAPVGGRLADRLGRRLPTVFGLAVLAVGALPIAMGGADIGMTTLVVGLSLIGRGLALATPGLQATSVESVRPEQAGAAAGVYSTSRYIGSILGSAIMAGLLRADRGDAGAMGLVFVVVLVAGVLAAVVSLGLRPRPQIDAAEARGYAEHSR